MKRQSVGTVTETLVYRREPFVIGRYVWTSHGALSKRSRIGAGHLLVVPWRAVRITQDGSAPFVADPGSVVYYNANQPYHAQQIDARGEHSVYFGIDPLDVTRMVRSIDASSADRDPRRPLDLTHARCSPQSFMLHRLVFERACHADADPIVIEQLIAELVHSLLADGYRDGRYRPAGFGSVELNHRREQAELARLLILRAYRQRLGLWEIAHGAGVSSYHLCRIFRQHVGMSVHQYLTSIRLRAAIDLLCVSDFPLASIALELGFSSQAHFTTAFAREFRCTPGAFRKQLHAGQARPSTILKDSPARAH